MFHVKRKYFFIFIAVLAFVLSALSRLWAAPLSTGPDVAQFWAFAKVFDSYGLDFYRYADATLDIFPYQYWAYYYPPLWLLVLRTSLLAVPQSLANASVIDVSWRVAEKIPLIVADLAIGGLLLWAVPGSKWKKLLFSSLWLFHPTSWYESGVFGQFDSLATAFLLSSLILLQKGRDRLAFLFAGLAVLTKQHTFVAVAPMLIASIRPLGIRRFLGNCAISLGLTLAVSIPFVITDNLGTYIRMIFMPVRGTEFLDPLVYTFSGSAAILKYLNITFDWDTLQYLRFSAPVLIVAMLASFALVYIKKVRPAQAALLGILVFVGIFYRINYQYLIVYIPLALLVAAQTRSVWERGTALLIALLPAVWLWFYDVPFWFTLYEPSNDWVVPFFDRIGMVRFMPDWVHVALASAIMVLSLAYPVAVFTRWHRQRISPESSLVVEKATSYLPVSMEMKR